MNPTLSLIVAVAQDNVIGKDNTMPWHLPADLKHFKSITYGHPVIMGRKTFESIGKPLPGRKNIVLSTGKAIAAKHQDIILVHSMADALKECREAEEVFVIGGNSIYQLALPLAERIYLTRIDAQFPGDTFFPELNKNRWVVVEEEKHQADDKNPYDYIFQTLEKARATSK
ncbi:MAG: type 3 dihydrofolate reductase [Bacteroidales bacterium]